MKTMILAAIAALTLGLGAAQAASSQLGSAPTGYSAFATSGN